MRKQIRPPEPEVLARNSARWNEQWEALRQRNPNAQFVWYEVDGVSCRNHILPTLEEMTQGHCAFCDSSPLDDRTTEPIEHFRPKSLPQFYRLAYAWKNLFYACGRCQSSKGNKWDDDLMAPDEDGYRFSDYFYFDLTTGALLVNPLSTPEQRGRAEATIRVFDLDNTKRQRRRREELWKWQRSTNRHVDEWAYRDFLEAGTEQDEL